ncbi:MAG: hypothetical protein ABIT01_07720 [Thermoanaerobaculia bacterium]
MKVPDTGLQHVLPEAGPANDPVIEEVLMLAVPPAVRPHGTVNAIENVVEEDDTVPVRTGPPAFENVAVNVQSVWVTTTGPVDV